MMIIMDVGIIATVDDGIASIFFPAGEVLDDFFFNELVDGGGGVVWGRLNFIYAYRPIINKAIKNSFGGVGPKADENVVIGSVGGMT